MYLDTSYTINASKLGPETSDEVVQRKVPTSDYDLNRITDELSLFSYVQRAHSEIQVT